MYSDWTTRFFEGLAVEFWLSIAPEPAPDELAFLQSMFTSGGELLDLACGAGRHAIPLVARGYRVTAVDRSDEFLAAGRSREPRVDWQHRDVRDLPWRERFDGALSFGNSFAYFPRGETRAFLAGVARSLRRGAPFVLETAATAESLLPNLQRERRIEHGGIVFRSASEYDARKSRLDIDYTFEKDGVVETKRATTWVYTSGEVASMIEDAGFTVDALHASSSKDPFILGSPRAIFVATARSGGSV